MSRRWLIFICLLPALLLSTGCGQPKPKPTAEMLRLAIKADDCAEIKKIVKADRKLLTAVYEEGKTPLLLAIDTDKDEAAEILIKKGADVNAADAWGMTPLTLASSKGKTKLAFLLRRHGAKE